ncbi:T9SS type A sorting domain-containing protein (plasmid) [Pedobacter sp. BS3]|uniref:T9SS type A sorting domain-containing protein n=1 Tax=Pedobacter sp. BS3 TaxID=2567937 RepID=UPI0011EFDCB3|nr:T9SS type A sorting domain-containing protein [Pedobacter sp. BS3]TZF85713.1 T9SS type A sorting domain-containing protein [Pedobacter sp. BS3]
MHTACGNVEVTSDPIHVGLPYWVNYVEVSSNGLGGGTDILCNHDEDYDDYANTYTYTLNETPSYSLTLHATLYDAYGSYMLPSHTITSKTGTYSLPESMPVGYYGLDVWVSGGPCNEENDVAEWYEAWFEYANCDSYERLAIYPNPANTELTIGYPATAKAATSQKLMMPEFSVKLLDDKGRILKTSKTIKESENLVLPVADIPNGTYYLHIKQGRNLTRQQVVIYHE